MDSFMARKNNIFSLVVLILAGFILSFPAVPARAQNVSLETVFSDEMVVTGSLTPRHESRSGMSVSVLTADEIAALPAKTVSELLDTVGGLDVRQRGGNGAQTDIAVRGSSFEQVLILVDGINLSDAQTGHHNMDLVVTPADIKRIEILKGPAASIYGHNAMAGVINIITRSPESGVARGMVAAGSHRHYQIQGGVGHAAGIFCSRITAGRTASDGHLADNPTDGQTNTFFYKGEIRTLQHSFTMGAGITEKNFGAYKFYSDTFPNQRENTQTLMIYGKDSYTSDQYNIDAQLFWRRHQDAFYIEINDHWQKNEHTGNTVGTQLHFRTVTALVASIFGAEAARESLESSSLGNHHRSRYSLLISQRMDLWHRLSINVATTALHYSDWGWQHWPGADVSLKVYKPWVLFAAAGKSFRVPTYTELYYDTPANRGNPDLTLEKAVTYEVGCRFRPTGVRAEVSLFRRDAEDLIDWTRQLPADPWQVRNIADIRTQGYEVTVELFPGLFMPMFGDTTLALSYTRIDVEKYTQALASKYLLDHLAHQAKAWMLVNWCYHLSQSVVFRYEKRINHDDYTVFDSRMTWEGPYGRFFVDVRNLFDRDYVSNGFAPAPGRRFYAGVSFSTGIWD